MRNDFLVCVCVVCGCVCASAVASLIAFAAALGWPLSAASWATAVSFGAGYGVCGGILLALLVAFLKGPMRPWVVLGGIIVIMAFVFYTQYVWVRGSASV